MEYFKRPTGLLLMLVMLLMALQVGLKKPICIDSSIVYKIDRLSKSAKESIYSCNQLKHTGFSAYFFQNIDAFNRQLSSVELQLKRIGLSDFFILQIDDHLTNTIHTKNDQITISSDLVGSPQLDAEILKQSLFKNKFKNQIEMAETISDFITGQKSKLNQLSQVWQLSFDQLNFTEKFSFRLALNNAIKNFKALPNESSAMALSRLIFNSDLAYRNFGFLAFKEALHTQMVRVGLLAGKDKFDIVLQIDQKNKLDLDEIKKWSAENSQLKMALQDESGFYTLPYMVRIAQPLSQYFKTDYRIVFSNPRMTTTNMVDFFNNTEHLVLVSSDSNLKQIHFQALFKQGLVTFLAQNKKLDFIQFHMSSFQFRAAHLRSIKNYFTWLKDNNINSVKQKALGWQSQFWSLELQAYKPVAVYDAIQSYRVN